MCCDSPSPPPPPDYTPVAQASEEAALIAAEQADRVLAEHKRQYDLNMEVIKPIVAAQRGIMEETARQGKDYYDYMASQQRPVEMALREEAMQAGTPEAQNIAVSNAIADSQAAYTRALNQAIRQGLRYGINAPAITGEMAVQQAQNTAAMANAAREKEKLTGYAKRLDIAGLYRGLSDASRGAYSVAINAGDSSARNQMAPGQQLLEGTRSAAGLVMEGQQQKLGGLSNILNAQANIYAAGLRNQNDDFGSVLSGLGSLGQGLAAMKTAKFFIP